MGSSKAQKSPSPLPPILAYDRNSPALQSNEPDFKAQQRQTCVDSLPEELCGIPRISPRRVCNSHDGRFLGHSGTATYVESCSVIIFMNDPQMFPLFDVFVEFSPSLLF